MSKQPGAQIELKVVIFLCMYLSYCREACFYPVQHMALKEVERDALGYPLLRHASPMQVTVSAPFILNLLCQSLLCLSVSPNGVACSCKPSPLPNSVI